MGTQMVERNGHGNPADHEQIERLGDAWNAFVAGGSLGALEPADADAIRRFHRLATASPPLPGFVDHLKEHLMDTTVQPVTTLPQFSRNRRALGSPPMLSVPPTPARSRRWSTGAFATAALVLLTLFGIYATAVHNGGGDDGGPTAAPGFTADATPGRLDNTGWTPCGGDNPYRPTCS